MAPSKKSSASHSKPSKSRPISTSSLSQPSQSESSSVLSSFSPDGTLFALATLAVDKHRIRVYNVVSGQAVSEYTVDSGRISVLSWSTLHPGSSDPESRSPSKKRKKTRSEDDNAVQEDDKKVAVLVIGLSNGIIMFFSPTHSKVIRTLSHPTSTTSIFALAIGLADKSVLWTSSADSTIRLWDIEKNHILRSWKNDDHIPSTSFAIRPDGEIDQTDLLVAHHHIRLLEVQSADSTSAQKPTQIASFTGHASPIKNLLWSTLETPSKTFFSSAESDRFIYVWNADGASLNEKSIASMSLDSDVRSLRLDKSEPSRETLIALSSSGKLTFTPIPTDFPRSVGDKASKTPSLVPRSTLSTAPKRDSHDQVVLDFVPVPAETGSIRVVRLVKGVRPVFDIIRYLDESGNYISAPVLDEISQVSTDDIPQVVANKRYTESTSLAIGSGFEIAQDHSHDDAEDSYLDGSLQVDLAELSLGQRLTAVVEGDAGQQSESDDDDLVSGGATSKTSKKQAKSDISVIPANSLTRTLIQALHSSDSRLLEMCLTHSDPILIRNTVRRLPPQLAIPLITACVDRLGRGARAANMKGGGGGASSQRGMGLLTWLKTVLAIHTGHLMTIPDLVARLSGLHATLTARLSLHDSLLSLSGRLDMVLAQVETRASTAPTPVTALGSKTKKAKKESIVKRYTEGETDSGDDDADMDVQVEVGSDDEGSVEDIELGGESDSNESEEDDDDDSEDDDDPMSKFIDDEAEEEFSDEEDEEESE